LRGVVALVRGWCACPELEQALHDPTTGELFIPSDGPIRCTSGEILECSLRRLATDTAEESGVHSQLFVEAMRVSKEHGAELALEFACELLRKLDEDAVSGMAALFQAEEHIQVLGELLGFSPRFEASRAAPRRRRGSRRESRRTPSG
jgi:hypothetical protein